MLSQRHDTTKLHATHRNNTTPRFSEANHTTIIGLINCGTDLSSCSLVRIQPAHSLQPTSISFASVISGVEEYSRTHRHAATISGNTHTEATISIWACGQRNTGTIPWKASTSSPRPTQHPSWRSFPPFMPTPTAGANFTIDPYRQYNLSNFTQTLMTTGGYHPPIGTITPELANGSKSVVNFQCSLHALLPFMFAFFVAHSYIWF